jgi:hypothetical protein
MSNALELLNNVLLSVDSLGRKVDDFVDEYIENTYFYTIFKRKIKIKKRKSKSIGFIQYKNYSGTYYKKIKTSVINHRWNKKLVKKWNKEN